MMGRGDQASLFWESRPDNRKWKDHSAPGFFHLQDRPGSKKERIGIVRLLLVRKTKLAVATARSVNLKLRGDEANMGETELQMATRQASDQKQAVLRQQAVVLGLKNEGGPKPERATELLESLRQELLAREARLARLVFNA